MNIKLKLTFWFTIIVAGILGASFYIVYQNYSLFRQSNFFDRLSDRSQYTTKAILDSEELNDDVLEALGSFNLSLSPSLRLTICDSAGQLIESISTPIAVSDDILEELRANNHIQKQIQDTQYVYFTYQKGLHNNIVLASAYDRAGFNKVSFLRQIFLIIWVLSVFTTAFAGWWFARISLRPMTQVMNNVSNITEKNLHSRLPISQSNDEIAQLSNTFNQMLDRLESAFILQKDFVSNASHEFRTPLTAIKGQVQVALLKQRNTAEYETLLQSLNDDINNLIGLLNALQELAKANANALPKSFGPVSLLDIVLDVQNEFAKTKPQYTIAINVHEETGMPSDSFDCLGETSLLKSVVSNLIDNACKFSPDFKCNLTISFNEHSAILQFTDEGVGIAPENIDRVFEPFFRGNDTRNIYGHGIGLSLVKRIIELHKGTIDVLSTVGKGTTFTLQLPLHHTQ
jgi:signal transduction histidine kinase